jgi:uncharacterized protein YciU (UPF0263 family)
MRLVRNPSYKHSSELIREFNKHKDSISFKDHTQYTDELLNLTLNTVIECKRLGFSSKYILWLTKQIYENQLTKDMVKDDYLPLIKFHFNNQDFLKPISSYSNVSELNSDIESLGEESEAVSEKELDIFFEKDGWILTMPHTTKASCLLGKGTDWCTSRTKSQNLFLSYIGRYSDDIVLFYVIKIDGNPKKNPNDKLSVGFENGKPIFDGKSGGLTVNASNKGILIEEFGEILGKELAQIMLVKMDEKSQSIKGKHPAKKEMERIAKSVDKYLKKISEFKNEDELNSFKQEIAQYNLSKDMQIILSEDENQWVRANLASNPNLIESIQIKLADDEYEWVRRYLALNPNLIESLQLKLADDEDEEVRGVLAQNPNLFESVQIKLADDKDKGVREILAENPNLFESVQIKLADDKEEWVRANLAKNPNLFESLQLKLADDEDEEVRGVLAQNPNIFESVQLKLADNKEEWVRENLAENPNLFESAKKKLKRNE